MKGYVCIRNLKKWSKSITEMLNWLEHMDDKQQAAARNKFAYSYVTSFWFRFWICGWKHALKPMQTVWCEFVKEQYIRPERFMWWEHSIIEKIDRYLKRFREMETEFDPLKTAEMYLSFDQMEIFSRVERARHESYQYPKKNHDA